MLVALVAVVVGGSAVAARAWVPNLTNSVTSAVRRALCVAGGGRCAEAYRPRACVVASRERRQHAELTVVVRMGVDGALLRDERSDGSVVLTWIDDAAVAGVLAAPGGRTDLGERETEGDAVAGAAAKASGEVRLGGGVGRRLRWELPSRAAADALQRRLVSRADELLLLQNHRRALQRLFGGRRAARRLLGSAVPPSDAWAVRLGATGEAEGAIGLPKALEAKLGGTLGGAGEYWWDRRRRRATVALEGAASIDGEIAAALGPQVGGKVEVQRRNELVLDERGRPLELVLRGRVQAWADAGGLRAGSPRRPAGSAKGQPDRKAGAGGKRWNVGDREVEARLDLTDPSLAAVAEALVRSARERRGGDTAAALRELVRNVGDEAAIDVRRYETTTSGRPWGVSGAFGVKAGVGMQTSRTTRRLVGARTRPPGGTWETRLDCGVRARG